MDDEAPPTNGIVCVLGVSRMVVEEFINGSSDEDAQFEAEGDDSDAARMWTDVDDRATRADASSGGRGTPNV